MGKGNNSQKKEGQKAKEGKAEGPGHAQDELVVAATQKVVGAGHSPVQSVAAVYDRRRLRPSAALRTKLRRRIAI